MSLSPRWVRCSLSTRGACRPSLYVSVPPSEYLLSSSHFPRSFTLSTFSLQEVCSTLLKLIFLFLILIYFNRVFRDSPFTLSSSLSLSFSQRQIVETQLLLCPHSFAGCPHRVRLCDLASHLSSCDFALALSPRPNKDRDASFTEDYEVVCPYASFGCTHTCMRANLQVHLTRW